jgi:trimeric autotransporter adhesin
MFLNTLGGKNVSVGTNTLRCNVTGTNNTALGYQALLNNTASNNTAVGFCALRI